MSDLQAGEIDKYKIYYSKVIGQGQFGTVYECLNMETNDHICVKVLEKEDNNKDEIQREVMIVGKIKDNPNINLIEVYDIKFEFVSYYIFMKKYPQTLEQMILKMIQDNKLLPLNQIIKFTRQLINGYRQLHQLSIVHRDLKPANILVGDDGELKITDFGLAKIMVDDSKIEHTHQIGTMQYTSPQQMNNRNYTSKSDVFSLGCIIYFMIFQKPLFVAKPQEISEVMKQQLNQFVIPNILNQGTVDEEKILVDLLKLTLTFDEINRISWEELFKWFLGECNQKIKILEVSNSFPQRQAQHSRSQHNLPLILDDQYSLIKFSDIKEKEEGVKKNQLIKKQQNAFYKFMELIFGKATLARFALDYLDDIKQTNIYQNDISKVRIEILEMLLIGFQCSITLNAYNCCYKENNYKVQINQQIRFPKEVLVEYQYSQQDLIQKQRQKLFDEATDLQFKIITLQKYFYNIKQALQPHQDILDFFTFEIKQFYNYENFLIKYSTNLRKFLQESQSQITKHNKNMLLKLKAYSIRFLDKSGYFLLKNYETIDVNEMINLNDNYQDLQKYVRDHKILKIFIYKQINNQFTYSNINYQNNIHMFFQKLENKYIELKVMI